MELTALTINVKHFKYLKYTRDNVPVTLDNPGLIVNSFHNLFSTKEIIPIKTFWIIQSNGGAVLEKTLLVWIF